MKRKSAVTTTRYQIAVISRTFAARERELRAIRPAIVADKPIHTTSNPIIMTSIASTSF
jgi:IMP cyclohydrolase